MDKQLSVHEADVPPPLAPRVVVELVRVVCVAIGIIGILVVVAALRAADGHDPRPVLDTGLDGTLALAFQGLIAALIIGLYTATYTWKPDPNVPDDSERVRMFSLIADTLAVLAVILGLVPIANGAPDHLNVWLLVGGPTVGVVVAALALDTSRRLGRTDSPKAGSTARASQIDRALQVWRTENRQLARRHRFTWRVAVYCIVGLDIAIISARHVADDLPIVHSLLQAVITVALQVFLYAAVSYWAVSVLSAAARRSLIDLLLSMFFVVAIPTGLLISLTLSAESVANGLERLSVALWILLPVAAVIVGFCGGILGPFRSRVEKRLLALRNPSVSTGFVSRWYLRRRQSVASWIDRLSGYDVSTTNGSVAHEADAHPSHNLT